MNDRTGIIPHQLLIELMEAGYVRNAIPECVTAASLDVRITDQAYRMRGSYIPKTDERIADIVANGALFRHDISQPLEVGGVYLIRLAESLALPAGINATANGISSFNLLNVRTRLLADRVTRFNDIPRGYTGSLWVEVSPHSFPILVHAGDKMHQLRFFHGDAKLTHVEQRTAYDKYQLLRATDGTPIPFDESARGISLRLDLSEGVGWRARSEISGILDMSRTDQHMTDFFEPITLPRSGELLVRRHSFHVFTSKERLVLPTTAAARSIDSYASEEFFSPGFDGKNLLTCSPHEDLVLRDGQTLCTLRLERLLLKPDPLSTLPDSSLARWFVPLAAQLARQPEMS